jgi:hypothetical protein
MMTTAWEPGTRVRTPAGEIGIVVVTSYRSHIYCHPGEPRILTVDVLIGDSGQVLTYRADRLRPMDEFGRPIDEFGRQQPVDAG